MRSASIQQARLTELLALLDEAYNRKSWHGTNLRGSLRGVPASIAGSRPMQKGHSIAELALHAAYWKYAVRRRITGEARASFPLKGSNWFAQQEPLTESEWKRIVKLLDQEHAALRAAASAFDARRLEEIPPGARTTFAMTLRGVAMHDLHHGGQIQMMKRLLTGPKGRAR